MSKLLSVIMDEEEYKGLTFTAQSANATIDCVKNGIADPVIYYSRDGVNWTAWGELDLNPDTNQDFNYQAEKAITLTNIGDKVYFKGDNPNGIGSGSEETSTGDMNFIMTGTIAASGNINSLLDNGDGSTITEIPNDYCFYDLFYNCSSLTTPPELPATILKPGCYRRMFHSCTNLTVAPVLPAMTIRGLAYMQMFQNCTSLTVAPSLPATSMSSWSYRQMFYGCTSLTTPPSAINVTSFGEYACTAMFAGCTSLISTPSMTVSAITGSYALTQMFQDCSSLTSATNISLTATSFGGTHCYSRMFYGCTNLVSVPASLPATTLTTYCYNEMFRECRSLITAPSISATTLATYCCSYMFTGCDALVNAPAGLLATTSANYCYQYMFAGCDALVNAPDIYFSGTSGRTNRCLGMFKDCISLQYIKLVNYTGTLTAANGFSGWVQNVATGGTIYYKGSTTTQSTSAIPSGWTKVSSW